MHPRRSSCELEGLSDDTLADPAVVPLVVADETGRPLTTDRPHNGRTIVRLVRAPASGIATLTCALRYSTTEMLNTESRLLDLGRAASVKPAGLQTRCASRRCSRSGETYLRNRRRWCGRCAARGTGSSRHRRARLGQDLRPRRGPAAWQSSGYRVYGAALAAEAAAQLEAGSQISSVTLDRLVTSSPRRSTCRITASIVAASWSSTRPAWSTPAVSCGCWRSRNARVQKSCSQVMTATPNHHTFGRTCGRCA